MTVKFFGQFLLEKSAVTRDQLVSAVEHQEQANLSLCALAVKQGFINDDNVSSLGDENLSDKQFLEAALRNGLLTFEEIGTLSKIQCKQWLPLGEALVQLGYLSESEVRELMDEHKRLGEPTVKHLPQSDLDITVNNIVAEVISATIDMFVYYTQSAVNVKSVSTAKNELGDVSYVFSQNVRGDYNFKYALALPEELTVVVANHMFGEAGAEKEMTPVVMDALSEFVNIVVGHACAGLDAKNLNVSAEPPAVMTRRMMEEFLPSEIVTVKLESANNLFSVGIFFENP